MRRLLLKYGAVVLGLLAGLAAAQKKTGAWPFNKAKGADGGAAE